MILSRNVVNERILQSVGTRSATGHTKPKGLVSGANFLWWINSCRETKISLYSFQRNWWILQYKEYCNLIGWEVHLVTKSCSLKCSLTLMANYLHKKRNLQSNWTRDKIGHTQPKAVVSDTIFPFSLCPCKKKNAIIWLLPKYCWSKNLTAWLKKSYTWPYSTKNVSCRCFLLLMTIFLQKTLISFDSFPRYWWSNISASDHNQLKLLSDATPLDD